MKTELNGLSKQFHERAKAKGFWHEKREIGTLLMLIVSELAEALEADRKNKHADLCKMQLDTERLLQCYDENYSRKIFMYYAVRLQDYETIAKRWNGFGPKTEVYWEKVQGYLND